MAKTAIICSALASKQVVWAFCVFAEGLCGAQVFDGINAKFGVNVKQFFTGLAILVGVLHTVFVFLWIKFQKKLAERDAEAEVCFLSFLVSCGRCMPGVCLGSLV